MAKSEYRTGAKAYLDTFSGLVPCIVLGISDNGIKVKVTAKRRGYKAGEIIETYNNVVPRKSIVTRCGLLRIKNDYMWVKDGN